MAAWSTSLVEMTRGAERRLAPWSRVAFHAGDHWQRVAIDLASGALGLDAAAPRRTLRALFDALDRSTDLVKVSLRDRGARLAWTEFQNKLEAFGLFEYTDTALDLPPEQCVRLAELIRRSAALGPYRSVWALEGVGRYFAESMWRHFGAPRALLSHPRAGVPREASVPLHVGMGMCFATRALEAGSLSDHALREFVDLCRGNSAPGYASVAIEPLGLAARTLRPEWVSPIAARLARFEPELAAYFWHGAGRGAYFAPSYFMPFGDGRSRVFQEALAGPPDALSKANALAGAAWAFLLVNIRHPQIVEDLVRHEPDLADSPAFRNGIGCAAATWNAISPDGPYLRALLSYQPCGSGSQAWEEGVAAAIRAALGKAFVAARVFHWTAEVP
jgi:hypothetical protein